MFQWLIKVSKITGENTFNGDSFETEGNSESSNERKPHVWVFFVNF